MTKRTEPRPAMKAAQEEFLRLLQQVEDERLRIALMDAGLSLAKRTAEHVAERCTAAIESAGQDLLRRVLP